MLRPRPTPEQPERQRILMAAAIVLDRTRHRSLKVRQVLSLAEVSAHVFYRHFPARTDLMLALLDDASHEAVASIEAAIAAERTSADRLAAWVRRCTAMAFDDDGHGHLRLLTDADLLRDSPAEAARLVRRVIPPLEAVLVAGATDGSFATIDPAGDAEALFLHLTGHLGSIRLGLHRRAEHEAAADVLGHARRLLGVPPAEPVAC